MPQVRGCDLPGAVAAGMKLADPLGIDIEADDGSAERAKATATGSPT